MKNRSMYRTFLLEEQKHWSNNSFMFSSMNLQLSCIEYLTSQYLWYRKNADPTPEISQPYEEKCHDKCADN